MLQESHLNDVQSMNMKQIWVGQVFSSPGTGTSRGVCFLIAKNIPFKLSQSIIDKEGRYIIITGFLYNVKCTLINVYAPNTTQATFITSIGSIITKAVEGPIIICRDFNLVQDPLVDKCLCVEFRECTNNEVQASVSFDASAEFKIQNENASQRSCQVQCALLTERVGFFLSSDSRNLIMKFKGPLSKMFVSLLQSAQFCHPHASTVKDFNKYK